MKLGELIEALGGKVAQGSLDFVVEGVNSSALAGSSDAVFAEDAASAAKALASKAGVVALRAGLAEAYPQGKCVVETEQPRLWFARAARLLVPVDWAACSAQWKACSATRASLAHRLHRFIRVGKRNAQGIHPMSAHTLAQPTIFRPHQCKQRRHI